MQFVAPPEWIPLLPKPGTFTHPSYGDIALTRERNAHFVENFKSGIYQKRLPVDAEHQTKMSGALGWIVDARQNTDGTVDGRVEWNERGTKLLADNRFAYVSPEWYDDWISPEDNRAHTNILIGAALTTRPFFKEGSLRPLIASETGWYVLDSLVPAPAAGTEHTTAPHGQGGNMSTAVQFTEEQVQQFAEMKRELEDAKKAVEARETESRQATERIAALEKDKRTQQFTEQARAWYGEIEDHVSFLESLTPEQRAFYAKQQDAVSAQLKESNLFKEMGRAGTAQSDNPTEKLNTMTAQRAKEQNISFREAARQIMAEHPDLYEQSKTMNEVHSRGGRKNSAE